MITLWSLTSRLGDSPGYVRMKSAHENRGYRPNGWQVEHETYRRPEPSDGDETFQTEKMKERTDVDGADRAGDGRKD